MANMYDCSDGKRVSQATIDRKLSEAYRKWYSGGIPCCEGCGDRAIETSHIIAKARCKILHKTELIWTQRNTFPACRDCHIKWESNDSTLPNYLKYMEVVELYDPEGYYKRLL